MTEQPARPGSLAEALILLQSRLPRITKDQTAEVEHRGGGKHSYKYAKLDQVYDAVFPLLADLGLYWSCAPTLLDGRFVLDYALEHVSGASRGGQFPLPENVGSQAQGSAITYAERYSLCAVIGIAPADDDGKAATDAHENARDWRPPASPSTRKAQRSRGTAAEDTEWTTGPAGDDVPGTITDQQLTAIGDYWVSLGIPAEDRRPLIKSALNLDSPPAPRDLSKTQGETVIAYLRNAENITEGGA